MKKPGESWSSSQRLEALVEHAIDTLSKILDDPTVPARERAEIALRLLALGGTTETREASTATAPTLLPMQFVSIPDFLPHEIHDAAVEVALRHREQFSTSTVTSNEPAYRQSRVLFDTAFPDLRDAIHREITSVLPAVFAGLAHAAFEPRRFEVQMTAHGDGDFFKLHSDAAAAEVSGRGITFVYYFMARQPCGFNGGALRLYQTLKGTPQRHEPAQFHDVNPADNMIVFFDSHLMHEVLPLHVPPEPSKTVASH